MVSTLGMTNSCKCLRRLRIRIRGTIPVPMKRRVLVFSVLLVSCALAQESRPVLRGVWGATAAEGGGLKSKRLRPPAAHGRFLTTPTALFSKAHGLPGG